MIAIEFRFPTGKWHATPWGRQVNEGAVEWPPAPWRLLRALISVWYHKCHDAPESEMRQLVSALSEVPLYYLPPASHGHTRHYMPVANDGRAKIFDTFVSLPRDMPLIAAWPDVELSESQQLLLSRLLDAMMYFGRAESWVLATCLKDWNGAPNTFPANGSTGESRVERVRVLATVSDEEHSHWRAEMIAALRERKLAEKQQAAVRKGKSPEQVKLTKTDEAALTAALPESVFDALHADTNQLRNAGWGRPPGSRWVTYLRPADAFAAKPLQIGLRPKPRVATVARFAISSNVRPRLTEALWIGERIRTAAMSRSQKIHQEQTGRDDVHAATIFSGKDADGVSRAHGHLHAHYLCEAPEHDGRISHITLFAPMGFSRDDERALSRLRRVWGHGGHDLQLILLGIGQPDDYGGLDEKAGQSKILAESDVWISRTPFIPTRHPKIRRAELRDPQQRAAALMRELKRNLQTEIERRPWLREQAEALVRIDPILEPRQSGTLLGGRPTSWLKFRRERKHGNGRKAGSLGYGFRLRFNKPVRGPIVLGYGCHFGLGQFHPANDKSDDP